MSLRPDQRRFIRENCERYSPKALAKRLGVEPKQVRQAMRELGIEAPEVAERRRVDERRARRAERRMRIGAALDKLKRPGLAVTLLLIIAAALRSIHLIQVLDTPFFQHLHGDPFTYHEWAQRIVEGDWLGRSQPVFYTGPLYAYFVACVYAVFGPSPAAVCAVQVLLSVASVWLVYDLARRLFGPSTAFMAGLMAALYGMFAFYSSLLLPAVLLGFLSLLCLALLAAGLKKPAKWKWLAAGILLGFSTAARGMIALFAPLVALAIATYFGWRAWRRWLPAWALLGLGFLAAISPLAVHNYALGGDLVLLTSDSGAALYTGNCKGCDGIRARAPRYRDRPLGLSMRDQLASFPAVAQQESRRRDLKPSEVSRFWIGKSLDAIAEDPGAWLCLLGRKARYYFNAYELPDQRNYYFSKRFASVLRLPLVSFGILLPLALVGLLVSWGSWRKRGLLLAFFSANALVLIASSITARDRLPVVIVLCVFAAAALRWLWQTWGKAARLKLASALAMLAVLYTAVYWPVEEIDFRTDFLHLADAHRAMGDRDAALASYDQALEIEPGYYYALYKKGDLLARMGRTSQARSALRKALSLARRSSDSSNVQRILARLQSLGGTRETEGSQHAPAPESPSPPDARPGTVRIGPPGPPRAGAGLEPPR
ncbi:MAG: glycosyltransferase family 39 protein [Deltaproteobacteria bacterium]|nr:glycosyltransferase family 39 protein [Deltaproteobacteria bacterium]